MSVYTSLFAILFCINNKHLLICMLLLEIIVLLVIFLWSVGALLRSNRLVHLLFVFAVTVSTSRVGLALIVFIARTHGEDLILGLQLLT